MAKRNLIKTAEQARRMDIPACYQITAAQLIELQEMAAVSLYDAFETAYNYGFVLGSRAAKKGAVK